MGLEADFRAHLAGTTSVTTFVGSSDAARIEPSVLPEDSGYPAVVYQRISTARRLSHTGAVGLPTVRMQVDCYAEGAKVFDLAEAVRKALHGFSGTMNGRKVGATWNADEDVRWARETASYRIRQDYMITHDEATT